MKRLIILLALCAGLAACNNKETPDDGTGNPFAPITLTKAELTVANTANAFAFDAYRALYKDEQMLFSPFSLSMALSMTACGANGATAEDMATVLGFENQSVEDIAGYYNKMVGSLTTVDKKTTFECANSVWIDEGFPVRNDFLATASDYFAAEAISAKFADPATINAVNKWCSDKTHGKIPKMLEKLSPETVMLLINALYFNGKWAFEFNSKTNKEKFKTIDGNKVNVNMMSTSRTMSYSNVDGWEMVHLRYGNGAFAMDVILPPADMAFGTAAASFDYDRFCSLVQAYDAYDVTLKMPEFKFEYSVDGLKDALIALGMKSAFTPYVADFSKMADIHIGDAFYIGDVKQKTYIDVNTKGTEAAAVTVVSMEKISAYFPPEPKDVSFTADRPFFFIIREMSTGSILFIGQKVK